MTILRCVPVLAVGVLAACGGNVVVDSATGSVSSSTNTSASSAGLGGATGLGGSTSFGGATGLGGGTVFPGQTGVGGGNCLNLPPPGTIFPCSGGSAVTGGSSGGLSCEFAYCVTGSNDSWLASCQGTTCVLLAQRRRSLHLCAHLAR